MQDRPVKSGYAALRRYRNSLAGADYFLTTNLAHRGNGLAAPALVAEIKMQCLRLETDGLWSVRTLVVMPDHVHLLVNLAGNVQLAGNMRLFKGRVTPALRCTGLKWQAGFYEHRLREKEDVLPIFHYVFLNPYRAGLASGNQVWTGYYCAPEDWKWFGQLTSEAVPQPEWLH